MAEPKNATNTQWGHVSDSGALLVPLFPPPALQASGLAPLVDPYGRPFINIVGAVAPPQFFVRSQIAALLNGQGGGGFRLLFAGAGLVSSLQVSLELVPPDLFQAAAEGVYVQIHDAAAAPPPLTAALVSVPMLANRVPLFLDDGVQVATGAVVVVSTNVNQYVPLPAGPSAMITSGVVHT